jgi:hypothetical protein
MAFDMWSVNYICHDRVSGNLETEMNDKDYIIFLEYSRHDTWRPSNKAAYVAW